MRKRIVFLGSKAIGYSCLEYLIEKCADLNVEIAAVLGKEKKSDDGSALPHSIRRISTENDIPFLESLDEMMRLKDIDILISVQYHLILKQVQIDLASEIAVNLHMAPLPDYRGCNQFTFAIIDQAKEFGTTLHKISTKIDGGDIIFEKRFPIESNLWVQELHAQTVQASQELFEESLADLVSGRYELTPQSNFSGLRPNHFHLRSEIESVKKLSLEWPKHKISRYIRATYFPPFDPPFFEIDGKKVSIRLDHNS